MDPDPPPPPTPPLHRILQRLAVLGGVPSDLLDDLQPGLITFLSANKSLTPHIVSTILPTDADLSAAPRSSETAPITTKALLAESLLWLQWLMFHSDPMTALEALARDSAGWRGVCGAVWGRNELAYRCHTCASDDSCAICVPCFKNGNHEGHDYSVIYTGCGCCDCGDESAWKPEGFCTNHRGAEQIQTLPESVADSVGPVLDALFVCWKEKLVSAEREREGDHGVVRMLAANELTSAVVRMLRGFCDCTESLLSFVARSMFECAGLLEVLVRAERFLDKKVVRKLHELILKLLSHPVFKYEFTKVFIQFYQSTVNYVVKAHSDLILEKYPMLQIFSVQIFTVPSIAVRLVREVNLLGVLLGCLKDLFVSCVGEDGRLQGSKWTKVSTTIMRLIEDIRYVTSHNEVPKYIAYERHDLLRTWIWLLSLVQGMDAQKRVTGLLAEDENEHLSAPFALTHHLGNISKLFVDGAFSVEYLGDRKDTPLRRSDIPGSDDGMRRHAKVGKLSQESSACSTSRNTVSDCTVPFVEVNFEGGGCPSVTSPVVWIIVECLKAMESSLGPDITVRINSSSLNASISSGSNIMTLRKKPFRIRKGSNRYRVYRERANRTSMSRMDTDESRETPHTEFHEMLVSSFATHAASGSLEVERGILDQNNTSTDASGITKFYPEDADMFGVSDDSRMELELDTESDTFSIFNSADWPDIVYDVSSQEISFHIPLHCLISLLLRKAVRACFAETGKTDKTKGISAFPSSGNHHDFFGKVLGGLNPCGFSALLMEHPLRLRVFCAQVHAGMWRKNGDAAIVCSELYHSVQWLEQGLESGLFLLQCCAALAPPELFVLKIQERFGLSSYTSFHHVDYNEYEPVLVQEMLTLLIQIVQERRFCGFSTTENLRRELVCKLALGDATHSQLVKALPRDLSESDQLQNVLDMLAVYSNPSGLKQGKYSLQIAHWKDLDLYHPRWSYKDLQAAEDRYLLFCKVSALNAQLPQWTRVFEPLRNISRIATSKAVFRIIYAVLFYALFTERSSTTRAPDGVLITALHLLSLALDVCEKIGADVGMQHLGDRLHEDIYHSSEDMFPILTFASEEFDAGATDESILWKNQSMLALLVSLMKKHAEDSRNNYAETRQCNISPLIENILKKFAKLSTVCMSKLERFAPEMVCRLSHHSPNTPSQNTSGSDFEERRAKARQRQAAILEKMRAEQSKFIASLESTPSDDSNSPKSKQEISYQEVDVVTDESTPMCSLCRDPDSSSPLCFLILLQKSRLTSFAERGPPSWNGVSQSDINTLPVSNERRHDLPGVDPSRQVQLTQNAALEFAFDIEPAEVDAFRDFFKERLPDIGDIQLSNVLDDTGTNSTLIFESIENDIYESVKRDVLDNLSHSVALDIEQRCSTSHIVVGSKGSKNVVSCVLGEPVASLSRGISRQHPWSMYDFLHVANVSSISTSPTANFYGFGPRDCDGIHISSCGHAVHQECHWRYLLSLKQRNIRRLGFEVGRIVDPDMGELLCPVCRRFANSILPTFPGVSNKIWRQKMFFTSSPTSDGVFSLNMNNITSHLPIALSLLQSTSKMVGQGRFPKVSKKLAERIEPALEPALRKLCMLYYSNYYGNLSSSGRLNQSLVLWDTLRYTLVSTEIASRDKLKTGAFSSVSCLETLYGEFHSSSGFILPLLFYNAQNVRSFCDLEALLRFRGIQLLAGSICSGVSGDNKISNSDMGRGKFSSISEHADKGESSPDIQFWNRAADPVIAHDPFSTLMWVLFCLPVPFISSIEFFIPLVHLFYVICVVQAMITCYSKHYFDITSFDDCVLNDLCKKMGEFEFVGKYFVSNYIDSSCHPKDMIRRLTFPYLRRCALLWKLLQTSPLTPLFESSRKWELSNSSMDDDAIDCTKQLTIELKGVRELENMFRIRPLESVLKDENVYASALKWCEHFCQEYKIRNVRSNLCSTPAVPFKLMQLPRVYQDLLQRYIKQQCSDCKSVPNEPALCLLCGRLCSPSWKPCCRASKCLNHAMACGAGIGVFLLVRRTTILLQRSSRQAVWPSPYLDAFGEEDPDIYRGKPLYLSDERYSALSYLVASHGLDRSSEVLRHTTIGLYGSD